MQKYICFPLRSPDHGRNLEFSSSCYTNKMHRGQTRGLRPGLQEIYPDLWEPSRKRAEDRGKHGCRGNFEGFYTDPAAGRSRSAPRGSSGINIRRSWRDRVWFRNETQANSCRGPSPILAESPPRTLWSVLDARVRSWRKGHWFGEAARSEFTPPLTLCRYRMQLSSS